MLNFPTLRTWVNHSPASRRCIWTTSWNWRWFETGWPAAIIETFGAWNIPQIALLSGKSGDKVWGFLWSISRENSVYQLGHCQVRLISGKLLAKALFDGWVGWVGSWRLTADSCWRDVRISLKSSLLYFLYFIWVSSIPTCQVHCFRSEGFVKLRERVKEAWLKWFLFPWNMPSLCFEIYALLESIPNKSARLVSASSARLFSCSYSKLSGWSRPAKSRAHSGFCRISVCWGPLGPLGPLGFSPMADFIGFPYLDGTPFCLGVPVWGSQILYKPWRLAFRKHVEHWKAGRKCVWKRPSCKMCRHIRCLFINGRYFNWQFLWGKPVNDNGFMIYHEPN